MEGQQTIRTLGRHDGRDPTTAVSVALFTTAQVLVGKTHAHGKRLSDIVNDPASSWLSLYEAEVQDLLGDGEPMPPVPGLTIRKDLVQLVVPQDSLDLFRPHVSTQQIKLELTTPVFRVRGHLHRRESDPSNLVQLISGFNRQFLPIADATIEYSLGDNIQTSANVVLVNSHQISYWAAMPGAE